MTVADAEFDPPAFVHVKMYAVVCVTGGIVWRPLKATEPCQLLTVGEAEALQEVAPEDDQKRLA